MPDALEWLGAHVGKLVQREFNHYLNDQAFLFTGTAYIAYYNDSLAGCCHLLYESKYSYFRDNQIPEINDLNVFPEYRRRKVASQLFDEFERIVSETSRYIGLGVGLYKDYGNAQRMYMSRGYVADGNGMTYKNVPVIPGKSVVVDDELIIYLVKDLWDEAKG